MFKKILLVALPAVAALGPPALSTAWSTMKTALPAASISAESEGSTPDAAATSATAGATDPQGGVAAPLAASQGVPGQPPLSAVAPNRTALDLAEVFQFEITPAQLLARWPDVSAGLSDLPLQGYRVPLVTGTSESDLAGSLTYYYNSHQRVQRITFYGATGDAGRLIQLMSTRFGLGRRLTNDPGLFRYEVPAATGAPKSFLTLRLARPQEPLRRFDVALVLERQ
jgi:hypothetical protein